MRQGKNVEKLLPDALPPPYGRPYTLVIDLSALVYKDVTVIIETDLSRRASEF